MGARFMKWKGRLFGSCFNDPGSLARPLSCDTSILLSRSLWKALTLQIQLHSTFSFALMPMSKWIWSFYFWLTQLNYNSEKVSCCISLTGLNISCYQIQILWCLGLFSEKHNTFWLNFLNFSKCSTVSELLGAGIFTENLRQFRGN